MTTRWAPDTCYCIVEYDSPTDRGLFIKRCRLHKNSTRISDVWSHNNINQIKYSEHTGTGKDRKPTEAARNRVRQIKESTNPDNTGRLEIQPIKSKPSMWSRFKAYLHIG